VTAAQALPAPELPAWLAAMVPFRRAAFRVGAHAMHVMEHGEGLPVVMLHGNPTWGFLWRKVARALEGAGLRAVMPDLVGLGLSDKPRDPRVHTIDFHAAQVTGLLDALGIEACVLAVQDWGGAIGGCVAAARPERVKGLVVLNTVLGPPRPGFRPTGFHRFAALPLLPELVFRWGGFMPRGMALAQGDRQSIQGEIARGYWWPLRHREDRVAPLAMARMVPNALSHWSIPALERSQAWAEAFRGPAELVWGDKDPVLGRARSRSEKLLPQAKVTRTGAGHFLQEEVPDEIAAAILRVAAEVKR
jgi:cis-3-alkyl-4-acyloxetan-2-one decarboxylase